jgi:hypothetical protein
MHWKRKWLAVLSHMIGEFWILSRTEHFKWIPRKLDANKWLVYAVFAEVMSKTDFPLTYSNVILSGVYTDLRLMCEFNVIEIKVFWLQPL